MIFDILYTRLFVQYGKTLLNYFGVTIYLKQNYKKKHFRQNRKVKLWNNWMIFDIWRLFVQYGHICQLFWQLDN